ncbi:MAG: multicopper oxidase domain-containing protein [Oryzihumus sp.]
MTRNTPCHRARSPRWARRIAALAAVGLLGIPVVASRADAAGAVTPAAAGRPLAAPARASTRSLPTRATTAVPAAAAGKLSGQGCTGSGTVSCDLWAMAGTTSLLGRTVPIWGYSSTGAAGSATAPGPLLVVHQGDRVTVTLHNQLDEATSLAFPGQPAAAFSAGLSATAEVSGTAAGGMSTYTFTAGRPGTYLYEAGHTADGTRQVAMGLAGAIVVLAPDGTAYGSSGTSYDDDAVVVLSEVDPALNAAPATFDMRDFAPKYRLINGKPFPSTDPVSTDQGHRVLLRYVNVGSQTHSMSLLGQDQTLVAQDGHPLAYAEPAVTEAVEPGSTMDSIVTMPTGPESKIALFEAGGHLDNNGQTTADPTQLAFGGMLTFLDTAAPVDSGDSVGPVSSHVTVSPNPSDGLAPVTVTADLSDATTGGAAVRQAEFVVDDAVTTGVGFGSPMTGTFGTVTVTGAQGTIPATADCTATPTPVALSCLDAGRHVVYVRAQDANGNWGVVGSAVLNLPKTGPQTTNGSASPNPSNGTDGVDLNATGDDSDAGGKITAAEYFVDTAGASGSGQAMTLNRSATVVSEDVTIPAADVTAMGEGVHHLLVHSKDSLGLWGPTLDVPFTVDLTGPGVEAASVGPNPSNGVVSDTANPGYLGVSARITDRDAQGAVQSPLKDAEAFLDPTTATPAGGTGLQLIATDGRMDSSTEDVYGLIPLSQVRALSDGQHRVAVRGQDAAGNWGPLYVATLTVDRKAPVLSGLVASPNPTNGAASVTLTAGVDETSFAAAEFWLGSTDPGAGKATRLPVSLVAGKIVVTVPLSGIPQGAQRFNLRVQDLAGNWSNAVNTTVTVVRPNAIFSDSFDSGTLSAWSSTTGGVSVTPAAGIPVGGSNRGLQVTLPGGSANRLSTVTDTTPDAETGYHARFAFNANTLTSGTTTSTTLTLLQARAAAGGETFALQFHRTGGTAQVRVVMDRTGQGAVTGAWVTLPAGAHTLQVDWLSGPATGASRGALTLRVDGTAQSTLNGNTSGLRVDTVLLGVGQGVTSTNRSTMAGTAFFDSFVSTRNTLP